MHLRVCSVAQAIRGNFLRCTWVPLVVILLSHSYPTADRRQVEATKGSSSSLHPFSLSRARDSLVATSLAFIFFDVTHHLFFCKANHRYSRSYFPNLAIRRTASTIGQYPNRCLPSSTHRSLDCCRIGCRVHQWEMCFFISLTKADLTHPTHA